MICPSYICVEADSQLKISDFFAYIKAAAWVQYSTKKPAGNNVALDVTNEELANELNYHPKTIQKKLAALEKLGFIDGVSVKRVFDGGKRRVVVCFKDVQESYKSQNGVKIDMASFKAMRKKKLSLKTIVAYEKLKYFAKHFKKYSINYKYFAEMIGLAVGSLKNILRKLDVKGFIMRFWDKTRTRKNLIFSKYFKE